MPVTPLSLDDVSGRPALAPDEFELSSVRLVYCFTGPDLIHHCEGRGELILTSSRIIFLSDEGPFEKSFTIEYSDIETRQIKQRAFDWPHTHIRCKLYERVTVGDEEDGKEEEQPVWIKRTKKRPTHRHSRRRSHDDTSDSDESESDSATMRSSNDRNEEDDEYEDRMVEEIRFVLPKPETQIPLVCAAWDRGESLTCESLSDDDVATDAASLVPQLPPSFPHRPQPSFLLRQTDATRRNRIRVQPVQPIKPAVYDNETQDESNDDDQKQTVTPAQATVRSISNSHIADAPIASPSSSSSSDTGASSSSLPPLPGPVCPLCLSLKSCSVCLVDRSECSYSGAQLKRKGKRMCKRCVARRDGMPMPTLHGEATTSEDPLSANTEATTTPHTTIHKETTNAPFTHPLDAIVDAPIDPSSSVSPLSSSASTFSSLSSALRAGPSAFLDGLEEDAPELFAPPTQPSYSLTGSARTRQLFENIMKTTDEKLLQIELEEAARWA